MAVTTGLPVVQVNVDKLITCTSAVPQSISCSKGIFCGKAAAGFLALQCNIGPTLAALTGDVGISWDKGPSNQQCLCFLCAGWCFQSNRAHDRISLGWESGEN